MRDIHDLINEKESALTRINEELEALRLTLRLLNEDSSEKAAGDNGQRFPPAREKEEAKTSGGKFRNFP